MTNKYAAKQRKCEEFGDGAISDRHRNFWGKPLYCTNADMIYYDYKSAEPLAMIDWKHSNIKKLDLNHPNIQSQRKLADKYPIPFFLIIYNEIDWSFWGIQLNQNPEVKQYIKPGKYTEKSLIAGFHKIRGLKADKEVLENASTAVFNDMILPQILGFQPTGCLGLK